MNKLINKMEEKQNEALTKNGAKAYLSTNDKLLDIFGMNFYNKTKKLDSIFANILFDDLLPLLLYKADIFDGEGCRNIAKYISKKYNMKNLWNENIVRFDYIIDNLIKFEEWDILDKKIEENKANGLFWKWFPSINGARKQLAKKYCDYKKISEPQYRKWLSLNRKKYSNLIETKLTNKNYKEIKLENVPFHALKMYRNTLEEKTNWKEFFNKLKNTKKEIKNAFPVDLFNFKDEEFDILWEKLPKNNNLNETFLVVADCSRSMEEKNGMYTNLNICHSLAIYFSEQLKGDFKDKVIVFSKNNRILDLSGLTPAFKRKILRRESEIANTNLSKVFEKIYNLVKENKIQNKEIPDNILIISDMQFDVMVYNGKDTIIDRWKKDFEVDEIKFPKIIFWNLNCSEISFPVVKNEKNKILISGFSTNVLKNGIKNYSPMEFMLDTLKEYERVYKEKIKK